MQARRATPQEIKRAQVRRARRGDRMTRRPITIGDLIGWTAMTLFNAFYIGVVFWWLAGIDSWEFWK